jgi:REP element-mobilizing transposase RayT
MIAVLKKPKGISDVNDVGYKSQKNMEHSHLKRLDRIWIENPIFFITACTDGRRNILANSQAAAILVEEWTSAKERHDWHIGCYVIMPNHVHFFCAPGNEAQDLSVFIKFLKEWTSKKIKKACCIEGQVWQREFFDHLLRSEESYLQKWDYVFNNSVRASLVKDANEWPWQGEIEIL